MKNISLLAIPFLALFLMACDGSDGPPGPPGPPGLDGLDGQDGVNILGEVLEIEGDFNAQNDFSLFFEFPQTIEVFESDLVLVFILFEQTQDGNGEAVDVWRLLPQTRILDQGLLQYNFDHTFLDVNIFMESDFDLNTLPPGDTQNQVFRIAVVPAVFSQSGKADFSNLTSVMGMLNVQEKDIKRLTAR